MKSIGGIGDDISGGFCVFLRILLEYCVRGSSAGTVLLVTRRNSMWPLETASGGRGRWEDALVCQRNREGIPGAWSFVFHLLHSGFRVLVDHHLLLSALRTSWRRRFGHVSVADEIVTTTSVVLGFQRGGKWCL